MKSKTQDPDITMADANEVGKGNGGGGDTMTKCQPSPNFVEDTHVTMAFAGEKNSVETLVSGFRKLQGREVAMSVTGLLWSKTTAALAVEISSTAVGDDFVSIPPCENSFSHVTVWVAPDVEKSLSNKLPSLVESGEASRVDFATRELLTGTLSFWNHKNKPFQVEHT